MGNVLRNTVIRLESNVMNQVGSRILQIGAGSVILYRILTEVGHAQYLYGPEGPSIGSSASLFGPHVGPMLDAIFYTGPGIYLMLALWGLGALGLVTGRGGRWAPLLALIGYVLVEHRTNISDGGDNVLRLVLFYMIFFHPKLTDSQRIEPGPAVFMHNLAVGSVYLQLMVLYLVAGITKLRGDVWVNGTAIYYVSHTEWFGPGQGVLLDLLKNPWIVTLMTYGAIFYQVGFAFTLFGRLHLPWVVIGIAFHLGIAWMMGLITFSAALITLILFSIRDAEWAAIRSFVNERIPRLTVYIDGYCGYCRATGRWLERLNLAGSLTVESFRHSQGYLRHGIDIEDLEREMYVVVRRHQDTVVWSGFDAVLALSRHLVPLWPFLPVVWFLGKVGLGPKLYQWLADRRVIVPDHRHCEEGTCLVAATRDDGAVVRPWSRLVNPDHPDCEQ